jgi:hypothetical protein
VRGVEAVALVGTSYLQVFALEPEIQRLDEATFIATGPEGSSGYRAAQSIIDGLGLSAALLPVEGDTPDALAEAMVESAADAAILMQPIGNSTALARRDTGHATPDRRPRPCDRCGSWQSGTGRDLHPQGPAHDGPLSQGHQRRARADAAPE